MGSIVLFAMTGEGVFAAMVGMGHGMDAPDADRGGAFIADVAEDGGRCGCVAGDAFAEGGLDVAVAELWPGETPDVPDGGAT